jgi:hypothetical protein
MKRYNLQLVEMGSKKVVYEEELVLTFGTPENGLENGVFIDNLIHSTFAEMEKVIEGDR